MQNYRKRTLVFSLITAFAFVFCGSPVFAQDCPPESQMDSGLMLVDIALARPIGIVATAAGFAIFVVSAPFSALGNNTKEAWGSLVVSPAKYTFKRPLGGFDCERAPSEKPK